MAGQVKVLLEAFPRKAVAVEVSTQAHRLQARRDVGERRIRLHVTHSSRTPIACATMSYCCALHTRGESGHACRLLRRNVLSKSCHLTLAFLVRTLAPTRFCVLSRKLIASPPPPPLAFHQVVRSRRGDELREAKERGQGEGRRTVLLQRTTNIVPRFEFQETCSCFTAFSSSPSSPSSSPSHPLLPLARPRFRHLPCPLPPRPPRPPPPPPLLHHHHHHHHGEGHRRYK